MSRLHQCAVSISVLLIWAAAAGPAAAIAPEIKDEGKFFSPAAIKKANEQIREIMRKYDMDLLIETYMTAPPDQMEKLKSSREERGKFFHTWAVDRAQALVVKGIYILVCKEPAHLQVEITPKLRTIFDNRTRDRLVEILLSEFQKKHYDQGLESAINFVNERLSATAPKSAQ
jgi:uncharacterized membrane protein YgcG